MRAVLPNDNDNDNDDNNDNNSNSNNNNNNNKNNNNDNNNNNNDDGDDDGDGGDGCDHENDHDNDNYHHHTASIRANLTSRCSPFISAPASGSFNCINQFNICIMYGITDNLFIGIHHVSRSHHGSRSACPLA